MNPIYTAAGIFAGSASLVFLYRAKRIYDIPALQQYPQHSYLNSLRWSVKNDYPLVLPAAGVLASIPVISSTGVYPLFAGYVAGHVLTPVLLRTSLPRYELSESYKDL